MALENFLFLLATILGAIGSVYVLKNIFRLTPKEIERFSATRLGYNTDQIDSLSAQKSESIIGNTLIIIALLIAIINSAITPTRAVIFSDRIEAIFVAITLSAIVYLVMLKTGKIVEMNNQPAVAKIIVSSKLDRLVKSNEIPKHEIKSLRFIKEKFLDSIHRKKESDIEFLQRIAKEVGHALPEDIRIVD